MNKYIPNQLQKEYEDILKRYIKTNKASGKQYTNEILLIYGYLFGECNENINTLLGISKNILEDKEKGHNHSKTDEIEEKIIFILDFMIEKIALFIDQNTFHNKVDKFTKEEIEIINKTLTSTLENRDKNIEKFTNYINEHGRDNKISQILIAHTYVVDYYLMIVHHENGIHNLSDDEKKSLQRGRVGTMIRIGRLDRINMFFAPNFSDQKN